MSGRGAGIMSGDVLGWKLWMDMGIGSLEGGWKCPYFVFVPG